MFEIWDLAWKWVDFGSDLDFLRYYFSIEFSLLLSARSFLSFLGEDFRLRFSDKTNLYFTNNYDALSVYPSVIRDASECFLIESNFKSDSFLS